MTDYRVGKGEAQEDQVTAAIEKLTSQIPSSAYLALALGSMAVSVGLQLGKKQHEALFVGQWAVPLLILGIYNKLGNNTDRTAGKRLIPASLTE